MCAARSPVLYNSNLNTSFGLVLYTHGKLCDRRITEDAHLGDCWEHCSLETLKDSNSESIIFPDHVPLVL